MRKTNVRLTFLLIFINSIFFLPLKGEGLNDKPFQISFNEVIVSDELSDGKWNYFNILNIDPERYERHHRDSAPILSGEISAFYAFQQGQGKVISAYLKLNNEHQIIRRVVEGEEIVNEETKTMAQVVKQLLDHSESVEFIKQDKEYFIVLNGNIHSLKQLLGFVNFNQITFSNGALNRYHDYIDSDILKAKPWMMSLIHRPTDEDFIKADPEGLCKNLNLAEKEAINIYTGAYYMAMNTFLRGDFDFIESWSGPQEINSVLREILLHSAVAISGLNKMPDYTPPVNSDGSTSVYLYRGENYIPDAVLSHRKWAVEEGGGVTFENGFISSAYNEPVSGFFGEDSKSGIMFKNLKGKKVTPLSAFGDGEREVLFPPTHIQWLYYKNVISDIYKNTIAIFLAKPVTAPLGTILPDSHLTKEKMTKVQVKLMGE
jgi:hypothetical protein